MLRLLNYKYGLYILLSLHFLVRLIIILSTDLGNDEVYYTLYAYYPSLSYFDHPPLVGILMRLSTFNLHFFHNVFFVRLGPLIIGTLNLFLIYKIGKLIKNQSLGLLCCLLYSGSFYGAVISGAFIMPDTPLTLFWSLSTFVLIKYIKEGKNYWLIIFGILTGFALLSKYQGIFLWIGAFLYFFLKKKKIFITGKFWLSIFLSFLIFSPVIWWNLTSEYSGIHYHTERIQSESWIPTLNHFFPEFFGQLFYNNPFTGSLIILALIGTIKKHQLKKLESPIILILCTSLPLVLTTLCMSLYNKTLPHWSGPAYFGLTIFSGHYIISLASEHKRKTMKKIASWGFIFFTITIAISFFQIKTDLFNLSQNKNPKKVGEDNIFIDISMWNEIKEILHSEINNDSIEGPKVIFTHKWFPGAHIDYYFALKNNISLYVLGNFHKKHEYLKINKIRGGITLHSNGYYITTSRYFDPPNLDLINSFKKVEGPKKIQLYKGKNNIVNLFIWKLINLEKPFNP